MVGRLVPENCIHHVTQAFEGMERRRGLKLVVVGDAPYATDYIRELKGTRDPDIIFTGYVFGDGYAQLMAGAYLCAVASEVGGTHPVLVEAMGLGNCVIVNDTEANLEVIGNAGVSYPGAEGGQGLRPVLQALIDDPERVAALRVAAKRRALDAYGWDAVARSYLSVFERVAAMRRGAGHGA